MSSIGCHRIEAGSTHNICNPLLDLNVFHEYHRLTCLLQFTVLEECEITFYAFSAWIYIVVYLLCAVNMRKTWVKRENIYYVPFYKQRTKMLLLGTILLGIIFFLYQVMSIRYLTIASTPWNPGSTINRKQLVSNVATEESASTEIKILRYFTQRVFSNN